MSDDPKTYSQVRGTHGLRESNVTDEELEYIADRVMEKVGSVPSEQHVNDHVWIKTKIQEELELRNSRKRVMEKIIGTVGAGAVLGLLGWFGHLILTQLETWSTKGISYLDTLLRMGGKS